MKKSNKLLLGGFITILILITAVHISLYAKYKAGNFTLYNEADDLSAESMLLFPNVLFVSVQNISGATVKFSDVARVEKPGELNVKYSQKGDTLLVSSTDSTKLGHYNHPVELHIPYGAQLSLRNSSLSFVTGKKRPGDSSVIFMKKSIATFPGDQGPLQQGPIRIVASERSLVLIEGNTIVNDLEVQLSNSSIESMEGNFGRLSIIADSSSRISLSAGQLLKANIKTKPE